MARTPKQDADTSREGALDPAESTSGTTDVQAAVEAGYFGVSPAREATGKDDKGLSQQTPEVMRRATADDVTPADSTADALNQE